MMDANGRFDIKFYLEIRDRIIGYINGKDSTVASTGNAVNAGSID